MSERGKTALLALAATALALLAAEVAIRVWMPVAPPAHVLDERFIYRLVPDSRRIDWRGRSILQGPRRIRINGLAYRGPAPDLSPDRVRVVVYGDSFIHGAFSDLDATFVSRLEKELHERGLTRVQALNAGVDGYGPDQVSLRIEAELDAFAPALVVVAVFAGNDFGDLMRNALYTLRDGELVRNGDFSIHHKYRAYFEQMEDAFGRGSLLNRSMLVRALRRAWFERGYRRSVGISEDVEAPGWDRRRVSRLLRTRAREYRKMVVEGDHRARHDLDTPDLDVSLRPHSESARYKLELMEAVLRHIRDTLAQRDVPMAIVAIPSRLDACDELRAVAPDYPDYRRGGPTGAIAAMGARLGVPAVDLFPVFAGPECRALYLAPPDNHWSAAGQAAAARRVAERLAAHPALAGR